jgi:nucleoside phosphorylase
MIVNAMSTKDIPLLVIAALKNEVSFLLKTAHPVFDECYGFYLSENYFESVGILVCGVGGKNVSNALNRLLRVYRPQKVLIVGWSGALSDKFSVLDLVVVNKVFHWNSPPAMVLDFDRKLFKRVDEYLHSHISHSHSGFAVTTDKLVDTLDLKKKLSSMYTADLVDMESYYLLKIFREKNIPSIMVRVISDKADESLGVDFEKIPRPRFKRYLYLLRHPKQCISFLKIYRDLYRASNRLGKVVPQLIFALLKDDAS